MEFKDRLRQLRKERKMTQGELGKHLGYGYIAISNYESGRNEPHVREFNILADLFGISVDYLVGRTDERHEEKGCDFCNTEYTIMSGSRMTTDGIHTGCTAKFCPNCGRELNHSTDVGEMEHIGETTEKVERAADNGKMGWIPVPEKLPEVERTLGRIEGK